MDLLWSPWRYAYIKSDERKETVDPNFCVFCCLQNENKDVENFILLRARHNFVVLNKFPYISGHLLIVPYAHLSELDATDEAASCELMNLTKFSQTAIRRVYAPHGFNLGMNLGAAAGAGVAGHLHMHIMPRWFGDSNFLSTVCETRNIPESLETTYQKLKPVFQEFEKQ